LANPDSADRWYELLLATKRERSSWRALFGTDTLTELRAASKIRARELDFDDLILLVIHARRPVNTDLAFWTRRLLLLPIYMEVRCRKPGLFARLPAT